MALNEAAASDVHVHAHAPDLAGKPGDRADSRLKSARADATHARAVPHLHLVDQGFVPDDPRPADREPTGARTGELEAALEATARAAEASDWARELMTPVAAAKQVAPAKGEAGNWIIWTAMTVAGLARLILVSLGYLVARGGETRIRAGVVTGVLVAAIVISVLVGHSA